MCVAREGNSEQYEVGKVDPAEATATVHAAIDHGVNYFDTAPLYGFGLAEERFYMNMEQYANSWAASMPPTATAGR